MALYPYESKVPSTDPDLPGPGRVRMVFAPEPAERIIANARFQFGNRHGTWQDCVRGAVQREVGRQFG